MFSKKSKSVETITAKLHDTVAELEAHAEVHLQKADDQAWVARAASVASDAHKDEHARAVKVAGNIKALLQ